MSVLKMGCSWASSYGAGIECDLVQNLRRELAAKQAKILHCNNCGDSYYDSGMSVGCPHCKLARYENAKMPEGNHVELIKHLREESQAGGELDCPICGQAAIYLERLINFAAAQTVRADENEADADRYRWLRDKSPGQFEQPIVVTQARAEDHMKYVGPLAYEPLDAAIDVARGQGGKAK